MGAAILDGARCSIRFAPEPDRMTCAGYADGPVGFELFRARHSPPPMLVIDDHRSVASHVAVQVMSALAFGPPDLSVCSIAHMVLGVTGHLWTGCKHFSTQGER